MAPTQPKMGPEKIWADKLVTQEHQTKSISTSQWIIESVDNIHSVRINFIRDSSIYVLCDVWNIAKRVDGMKNYNGTKSERASLITLDNEITERIRVHIGRVSGEPSTAG